MINTKELLKGATMQTLIGILVLLFCMLSAGAASAEEKIDASDPTKIYTYAGGGLKYTDYTNGEPSGTVREFAMSAVLQHYHPNMA